MMEKFSPAPPDRTELQQQLDRIEAQNEKLLRGQRLRLGLTVAGLAVIVVAVGLLAYGGVRAYRNILDACTQINALAASLQGSLATLDEGELDRMVQSLPGIVDSLSKLDVDALNSVIDRLPGLIDAVTALQTQVNAIAAAFGGLFG